MECEIDIDVDDRESYWTTKRELRFAQQPLRCKECGRVIAPGELYEHVEGYVYDEEGDTIENDDGQELSCCRLSDEHTTCEICLEVRGHLFCSYGYGAVWDDIYETLNQMDDIPLCWLDGLSRPAALSLVRTIQCFIDNEDYDEEEEL